MFLLLNSASKNSFQVKEFYREIICFELGELFTYSQNSDLKIKSQYTTFIKSRCAVAENFVSVESLVTVS